MLRLEPQSSVVVRILFFAIGLQHHTMIIVEEVTSGVQTPSQYSEIEFVVTPSVNLEVCVEKPYMVYLSSLLLASPRNILCCLGRWKGLDDYDVIRQMHGMLSSVSSSIFKDLRRFWTTPLNIAHCF